MFSVILDRISVTSKKLWNIKSHLKMEIATFFLITPYYLLMISISTFELEKACRVNLEINSTICDNLNNIPYKEVCSFLDLRDDNGGNQSFENHQKLLHSVQTKHSFVQDLSELELIEEVCDAEKESQKLVSKFYGFRAPIATTFTLLIVIFAGTWSDKYNIRRIFILIPFIGETIAQTIYIISSIYMNQIPIQYALYPASIVTAIFGSRTLFAIGVFSYMTVTTNEKDRTFRMGCYSMFYTFLGILTSPFSGILFEIFSYTQLFSVCLTSHILGFLFVLFYIPEVKHKIEGEFSTENQSSPSDSNMCTSFFDPSHVKDLFQVLCRKREGNKRKLVLLVILCNLIIWAPIGEDELYILFTRKALNWTTEFGYFATFYTIIGMIGTGIATVLFSKVFKLADSTLGAISAFGSLLGNPVIAFSRTNLQIYLYVIVDLFYYVRYISIKCILSKLVPDNELGRIYSILAITENLDTCIFIPIYNFIYYNTLDTFPGAIFLFSMMFLLLAFCDFSYITYLMRDTTENDEKIPKNCEEKISNSIKESQIT